MCYVGPDFVIEFSLIGVFIAISAVALVDDQNAGGLRSGLSNIPVERGSIFLEI